MEKKKKILIGAAVIIAIWAIWGLVQKANAKKDDVKDASPKYYVTKVSIPTPCSQNPQLQTVKKRSFRLSWGSSIIESTGNGLEKVTFSS